MEVLRVVLGSLVVGVVCVFLCVFGVFFDVIFFVSCFEKEEEYVKENGLILGEFF